VCFGLQRDGRIKQGQIAHLDQDRNNHKLDNLAFLCLDHHDLYDSKTSQSKGFTLREVRRFRKELYEAIDQVWKQPLSFGVAETPARDDISGHWIRESKFESAEFSIERVAAHRVRVSGFALWGTTREYGPNTGELEFQADLENGVVRFFDRSGDDEYRLTLELVAGRLVAHEENVPGYFGMNVSFEGTYERTVSAV
jgi:hypothetical protein